MATIGDLVVNLGLDTNKFKSGIDKAQSGLKSFGETAKSLINPIKAGFASVAVGAASAGVAIYAVANRISSLAGIADEAVKTGLSGVFLQRLVYAADQSGINVDTLTGRLKKLTIAIGKADPKPFEKLGVDFQKLKTLHPEQQFMMIAEVISKLPTAAERAAASVAIFGKSGVEITGLFAGGMGELNTLLKDAEALGIGISPEGLAKAAAADDAIQRMKASFGALFDQVTVGLAPAFNEVATAIANMIPPITKFFDKFNELEDKAQWINDMLVAGLDVGIESIKIHWATMLTDMVNMAADAAKDIALNMIPGAKIVNWGAENAFGGKGGAKEGGLAAAQGRLAEVMGRLGPEDKGLIRGKLPTLGGKPKAGGGGDIAGLASGLAESAQGLFGRAALAAQSKLTDMQIKGGFLGSVAKDMFTGERKTQEKLRTKETAGIMQRGSAEAFSTIVKSMMGNKDPMIMATEKQTKELVKQLKLNKPVQLVFAPEF